jgi:hypothetical protein
VSIARGLAFLMLAACAPRQEVAPPRENVAEEVPTGSPAVTLERTACFGGCPVYRLTVSSDGLVSYEGKAHVRRLGTATGQISPEQVSALVSELDRGGYFSFAPQYTPAEPACGRYATDLPTAITSVRHASRVKRIQHDYGCGSAPGALVVLERRIDEALGSSQWTGR